MFWKIIFALYSASLFFIGWNPEHTANDNLINISNVKGLQVILLCLIIYFLFNILYGLARKIRTISLNTTKVFIGLLMLLHIGLVFVGPSNETAAKMLDNPILAVVTIIIGLVLFGAFLSPLYVPLIAYFIQFDKFDKKLKNNYLTNFAMFCIPSLSVPSIIEPIYLCITGHADKISAVDIFGFISEIYLLICLIGFISRKDFIPRKILQYTLPPILLFNVFGSSIMDFQNTIKEYSNYPIVINVFVAFAAGVYIFIFCKYAYTNMISNTPDYVEIKTEKNTNK